MTTPPPPQDSNRAAYQDGRLIQPLSAMTETERRLIRAYLRCQRDFTKAAEAEGTTRQRVARVWRRWEAALNQALEGIL